MRTEEEICTMLQKFAEAELARNKACGYTEPSRGYIVAMETLAFLQKNDDEVYEFGNNILKQVDFTARKPQGSLA